MAAHQHSIVRETVWDGIRASVLGAMAAWSNLSLQQWVMIATLVYTVLLIVQKAWQMKIPQTVWGWARRWAGVHHASPPDAP
ncbi:hypothetical protein [Phenylobacterium sp.]|uniref:hypothetical protein n=1 Tax=Phenylobacterium sp. TaxID=1871053 RepID=UPI0035B2DEA2